MRFDFEDSRVRSYLKLVTALSFLLLTVAILIVYNAPMTGYEYSVYQSTPTIFWVAIIAGLMTGILLFYLSYGTGSRLWVVGFFEILLTNILLVTVYLYRGFIYLNRLDSLSYIGYAKDVIYLGNFPSYNFYPLVSVEMASLGLVSGQSMVIISQILPAAFFTAYLIGMLCWARTLSDHPRFVACMMLASTPIIFAWFIPSIVHETETVLMLPLFFFILWKGIKGDPRFRLLGAGMILFFIYGHPLVAISVLMILTIILLAERLTLKEPRTFSASFVMFNFVVLTASIGANAAMVRNARAIGEQLIGMIEGTSTFGTAQGQASSLGLLSAVQSILVCTADDIIFVLLSLWLGVIIYRSGWRTHPMAVIFICFLGGSFFLAALVLFTNAHNPFRLINLNFIMIFAVPLVGYLMHKKKLDRKRFHAHLITGLVLISLVSTVFTVYQDPLQVFPNGSVTRTEIAGSNWFLTEQAVDIRVFSIQTNPWRYASMIYNEQYVLSNPELLFSIVPTTAHFESFLENNETGTSYLILSTYDIMGYTVTWESTNKFTTRDFDSLNELPSVNLIYTTNDLDVYCKA